MYYYFLWFSDKPVGDPWEAGAKTKSSDRKIDYNLMLLPLLPLLSRLNLVKSTLLWKNVSKSLVFSAFSSGLVIVE